MIIEPNAEARVFANATRQIYVALVNEGFSTDEALYIIGQYLVGVNH